MNMKKLINQIDKRKFLYIFRIIFLLFLLIISVNTLNITLSKYESRAISSADADVAFFILKEGSYNNSISLSNILPSNNPYIYTFVVSNFENTQRCDVAMKYKIRFKTTTNIPLTFEIIRNENYSTPVNNIIDSSSIYQDNYSVYYLDMVDNNEYYFGYESNQTDVYNLIVHFPFEYRNNPDKYQGLVDMFKIIIDAEQVV